jgi:putative ABC transport system substrate-binding protein
LLEDAVYLNMNVVLCAGERPMRRREFTAFIALAALGPGRAAAQGAGQMRRLAFLSSLAENDPDMQYRLGILWQALRDLGWEPGRNLHVDYRWEMVARTPADAQAVAAELVGNAPDIILAQGTASVKPLLQVTRSIPIVFVFVGDPVGQGFVASLKRPGGNATGFISYEFGFGEKMLQLLMEAVHGTKRVLVMSNPETSPMAEFLEPLHTAGHSLGVQLVPVSVHDDAEIERSLAGAAGSMGDGLLVLPDAFTIAHRGRIIALAAEHGLPAIYAFRIFAASGGLISYGIDSGDQFRRAAVYIDRILRGAPPAELPVQAPTKFQLVVNLKTAKVLGLTIPQSIFGRADEVIE